MPATTQDVPRLARDLHAAFMDDPVFCWVFREVHDRERWGRHVFSLTARRLVPHGLSHRLDGGGALWAAPGRWRETPWQALALAARTVRGVGWRAPLVVRHLLALEGRHPPGRHLYLSTLGVCPEHRGRGLGSALLEPGCARADAQGLPAYLESSNPRNLSLYRRLGFTTTGEHQLPDGPLVTLM
ncbi:N-acetyltransferase [Conexibacter sp. SYSU D00693]|uniref:GNAT family N-acetyltransferase n=1 Tax=Conexibacter sp. SYSU D00693 TaxID=2812560 RepID=UPI00196A5537|nr:N-acetyltransferase [Conexibacter sp. SYSU D00693]